MSDGQVDVSVYMLTYYHEKYLEEAIKSVLSQKTKYKYELIISDDCSKDGTVDILKQYEAEYPEIISVNYNSQNLGIPQNMYQTRCRCKGRYIVPLSGDDYWIDERKIEKQASFLDEHLEYLAVFNCCELRVDESKKPYETMPPQEFRGKDYSLKDYEQGRTVPSHGFMMRNEFLTEEGRKYFRRAQEISKYVDDAVDTVLLLKRGKTYVLDNVADVHRVIRLDEVRHNYNSRYTKQEKFRHHIDIYNALEKEFGNEIDFSWWFADSFTVGFLGMVLTRDFKTYKDLFKTIPMKYKKLSSKSIYVKLIPNIMKQIIYRLKIKKK